MVNGSLRSYLGAAREACRLLDEKFALHVTLLKNPRANSVADYLVLGTATSRPHMEALEHHLRKSLKDLRIFFSKSTEGKRSVSWRVLDAGFMVIHLLDEPSRARYRLEELWSESKKIPWKPSRISSKRSKKT